MWIAAIAAFASFTVDSFAPAAARCARYAATAAGLAGSAATPASSAHACQAAHAERYEAVVFAARPLSAVPLASTTAPAALFWMPFAMLPPIPPGNVTCPITEII